MTVITNLKLEFEEDEESDLLTELTTAESDLRKAFQSCLSL